MTIRRAVVRRVDEEISNERLPPQDYHNFSQEQVPLGGQALFKGDKGDFTKH